MKSIAIVNTELPTAGKGISYLSGESLRDYDIVLFDPQFPYQDRIEFSGGGSTITVEGGIALQSAMSHWSDELRTALQAGKTIFIVLNAQQNDTAARGSTYNKGHRTYSSFPINNYDVFPLKIGVKNTKGKQIVVSDSAYRGLYDALKEVAQYKVILLPEIGRKIFATKDGASVAAVVNLKDLPGSIVFLPYFDLEEFDSGSEGKWSKKTLGISSIIANQLVAISETLVGDNKLTPPPEWVTSAERPTQLLQMDEAIRATEEEIVKLEERRKSEIDSRNKIAAFSHLLYESGKPLESIIENSLNLLGYKTENLRLGDLEIDHIITSPDGFRMVGESEGKDNAAISITKFRQLESNINEDFQREEVAKPAKGVLFGNGYRFTAPADREEQFTEKCLNNAKRLGTALIRTTDLYKVVVRVFNNPDDEAFKKACREAIETTEGDVVNFPLR